MATEYKPTLKEIDIPWNGEKAKVTIKRWTAGERNEVRRQSVKTKILGGKEISDIDPFLFQEMTILKCLVKAPFEKSLDAVRNLDPELFDKLIEETNKLNKVTDIKKSSS